MLSLVVSNPANLPGRHAKARRSFKVASSAEFAERMSIYYSIAYQQVVPTYVCEEASVRTAERRSASACRAVLSIRRSATSCWN
jgi:hypothetical protein